MNTPSPKLQKVCKTTIPWWLSFAVSAGVFLLGLIIIGLVHVRRAVRRRYKRLPAAKVEMMRRKSRLTGTEFDSDEEVVEEDEKGLSESGYLALSLWCERVTSRSTTFGRITCLIQVGLNLLSWTIYLAFTHYQNSEKYLEGDCYETNMLVLKWIDLALNLFFAVHFTLRAFASLDILKFWVLPTTLVDICVIPNIIITSFIDLRRQGMSFLRAIYLRYFVDYILVTFGVMKINSRTQIFFLIVYLLSVWMIASGFIHLLENIGDFWNVITNKQEWTFWECCYFMLVTVSTVGFGDYNSKTVLGRLLVCVYIIYAYALFGSAIPQIVFAFKNSKYHDKYVTRSGEKHIIVTGQLDNDSLKHFLSSFVCRKRKLKNRSLKLIILSSIKCERNLAMYLKKVSSSIKYLVGSPQNSNDMVRADIRKARAAVVLSPPALTSPTATEDAENIMTAVSIKAQKERIRVIVQLHLYSNKILLKMFPRWNKNCSDVIVCIDEMRLGLMAYSCLVPGVATLITNLLCFNEPQKVSEVWKKNYEEGLQNRLFNVEFSDDFHGQGSADVAKVIYQLFDVVLVAIKCLVDSDPHRVIINPMMDNVSIDAESMVAIVMARDELSANKVPFYCQRCSNHDPHKICKCLVKSIKSHSPNLRNITVNPANKRLMEIPQSDELPSQFPMIEYIPTGMPSDSNISIDDTGSFYWTQTPNFEDICISVETAESRPISDHILLCICGSGEGNIELANFMMPLRFQSLYGENLRPIVILGNRNYFEQNRWINIRNFPMFVIVDGSPVKARDLRAAGLFQCHSCAVITGNAGEGSAVSDKQALFCATLIMSIRKTRGSGAAFTTITDIREDQTASFFSSVESHEADAKAISVEHTEPYARGLIFTNSVLYRCIYSIYYNPEIFNFLNAFISGPYFNHVERTFGSGIGLLPRGENSSDRRSSSHTLLQLLPINQEPFNTISGLYEGTLLYGSLFQWALGEKKILCMGLYRLNFGKRQYVYTNPEKSTEVLLSDKVYCFLLNQIVTSKF